MAFDTVVHPYFVEHGVPIASWYQRYSCLRFRDVVRAGQWTIAFDGGDTCNDIGAKGLATVDRVFLLVDGAMPFLYALGTSW